MFKVPDWEDDSPKVNLSFPKKAKTNNKKNKKLLESPKLKGVIKPKLKDKNNLNQNVKLVNEKQKVLKSNTAEFSEVNITKADSKIIPKVKNKKHSPKRVKVAKEQKIIAGSNNTTESVENKKDYKLYDTDKLDELILNEKKQELNSYKKDDVEEVLFNENSENIKIKNPKDENNKSVNKIVGTRKDKNKESKSIIQKKNINDAGSKTLHQFNQISKPKDKRKLKVPKSILLQNGDKNKLEDEKSKVLQQLESQILKTKVGKNKKDKKSITLQNGHTNNLENETKTEVIPLENQISKNKVGKKKKDKKSITLQNGHTNDLENETKTEVIPLENQISKNKDEKKKKDKKSITLQNGHTNNLENETKTEVIPLENQISKNKDEKKKKVKKSILQNINKNNSENKINKEINPLSVGNKIIKIKDGKKKEAFKTILLSHRNSINVNGNKLRERMLERLKAAQFRYLNEKLYTSSGSDAKQLFQEDPEAFQTYHEGYQQQVKRWPVKPLEVIVKRIQKMPKTHTIADMGCGEAELSTCVVQPVRSFDLVASKPAVETCDMAHTPLLSSSMDVAVYCLALMGTDLTQYLIEANRVLKVGGHLLIAEVESRFHDVDSFTRDVQKLGFNLKKIDKSQKVFFFMEFTKVRDPPVKKAKLPVLSLKPCIYKKR